MIDNSVILSKRMLTFFIKIYTTLSLLRLKWSVFILISGSLKSLFYSFRLSKQLNWLIQNSEQEWVIDRRTKLKEWPSYLQNRDPGMQWKRTRRGSDLLCVAENSVCAWFTVKPLITFAQLSINAWIFF